MTLCRLCRGTCVLYFSKYRIKIYSVRAFKFKVAVTMGCGISSLPADVTSKSTVPRSGQDDVMYQLPAKPSTPLPPRVMR